MARPDHLSSASMGMIAMKQITAANERTAMHADNVIISISSHIV
jgi:hypothetical protein